MRECMSACVRVYSQEKEIRKKAYMCRFSFFPFFFFFIIFIQIYGNEYVVFNCYSHTILYPHNNKRTKTNTTHQHFYMQALYFPYTLFLSWAFFPHFSPFFGSSLEGTTIPSGCNKSKKFVWRNKNVCCSLYSVLLFFCWVCECYTHTYIILYSDLLIVY